MTNSKEMLQEAQDLLGLNQKELGVYIGVSTRTINSWMTGERECPMHVAELTLRVATEDARKCNNDEPTSGMFRWAVIDELRDGDEFLTVCGSKADAIREAENDWNHLTTKEKEKRARFQVGLVHVNYIDCDDGTRFSYFDTGKVIDGDVYDVAKSWL